MNNIRIFSIILLAVFFSACGESQSAKAKIFERKEIENNKLMIKYSFIVDGKSISDSAIVDNKIINSDSISVNYDRSNPLKNSLQLPK